MITINPFRALRPKETLAEKVTCPPYDVLEGEKLNKLAALPENFVHVIRSEVDFPSTQDPYSDVVYAKAKENLDRFQSLGILIEEDKPYFYLYRQIRKGKVQNGIVACASTKDYAEGRIKRHELTRTDKEKDRIAHFSACETHTEPVFLFYKQQKILKEFIQQFSEKNKPLYDFFSSDGVQQILWKIDQTEDILFLQNVFEKTNSLYIADGHHRTASSVKVGELKLKEYAEKELSLKEKDNPSTLKQKVSSHATPHPMREFNRFLSVIFPDEELLILPYNRVIKDLNNLTEDEFLQKLQEHFIIEQLAQIREPDKKGSYIMLLHEKIYCLTWKKSLPQNIVDALDVSILQDYVLSPLLGIQDPRTDRRIAFYGGDNMLSDIQERLHTDMEVAFLLYPTQIQEIIEVSDNKAIMPPKSTWFEPKLISGLFLHKM